MRSVEEISAAEELPVAALADAREPSEAPPSSPGIEEIEAEDAAAVSEPRPPPPPKRIPPPAPSKRTEEAERRSTRRPWWEEAFSDDFARADAPLTLQQIKAEVDFIERSLGVAAGGVILDLCCGAGHHAVELSSRGYGIVGYDLSLYQLSLAAEVAQDRNQKINFLQGDVREMAFEETFDGMYCWNTSFGYFEEEKNFQVAERMFKALRSGGMLLLDVVNRDFVAQQTPNCLWYEGDSAVCMDDMSIDFITSRLRVKRQVMLDDGRQKEIYFSVRVYSLHELGKLLHDVGFRVTQASGHLAHPGVFFGAQSPRIIILAQKP